MGVDNSVVARRYMTELWTQGKVELVDELVDNDIALKDPMGEAAGKAAFEERLNEMTKSFADNAYTIDELIVTGDRAIVRGTWRGRHIGDFFGVKPTNKTVTCQSVDLLKIANGKIVENISYFDVYDMFQQLGVLPPVDKLAKQMPERSTQPSA